MTRLGQYLVSSIKGLELDLNSDGTVSATSDDGSVSTLTGYSGVLPRVQSRPVSTAWTRFATANDSILQSPHNWVADSNGGNCNLNYTADPFFGSQCMRIITLGNGASTTVTLPRQAALNLTNKHVRIWYKLPTGANFSNMRLLIGSGAGQFTNFINVVVQANGDDASEFARPGEWASLTVTPFQGNTETGSLDWTAVQDFRFTVSDTATGTTEVLIGGIQIENNDTVNFPNGVVSWTFDDSYSDVFTNAKPILDSANMPATIYNIADYVGTSGRLTVTQLQQLQMAGWDIAGHAGYGADHQQPLGLTSMTAQGQVNDFLAQRQDHLTNGYRATGHYAYPKGYFNLPLIAAQRPWYSAARTTIGNTRTFESVPPADPMRLRVYFIGLATTVTPNSTRQTAEWAVDRCKQYGGWLIFYGHKVDNVDSGDGLSFPVASFQTLVSYVQSQGVPVRTVADVLGI